MFQKKTFALIGCLQLVVLLSPFSGNAQQNELQNILASVEKNNKELKALQALRASEAHKLKSGNNLPDPEFSAYYLPFGEHVGPDYSEFQVSQSFEFPTVYSTRKKLINSKTESLSLSYQSTKQAVKLEAKNLYLELVYLNKQIAIEQIRYKQAKQVYEHTETLFETEHVGALNLNKAKVLWLQNRFILKHLQQQKQSQLLQLANLNGGQAIEVNGTQYLDNVNAVNINSLWQEKLKNDPEIHKLELLQIAAKQELKLAKSNTLPQLTAGFNYQGIANENYSGFYGGITIPLWSNRYKVKAAKSNLNYQEVQNNFELNSAKSKFEKQLNEFELIRSEFNEYKTVLTALNSEELLLEAYQEGEISFMEYYVELQFYREAYDTMLTYQKQLHVLQAELLKHRL